MKTKKIDLSRFWRGLGRFLRAAGRLLRRVNWYTVVAVAACTLLYALLGRFASPPVPFAGRLRFQFAVLAFASVALGPLEGLAVGVLGQLLLGAFSGVGPWWSELAAAAVAGFGVGLMAHAAYEYAGGFYGRALPRFWLAVLAAHAVAFLVVCPALDMLLYRDALENLPRIALAAAANALSAMAGGTLLLKVYNRFYRGTAYYGGYSTGY